jgi:hypothetical protein
VRIPLLAAPAVASTPVGVTSSAPAVVTAAAAPIAAGATEVVLSLDGLAAGDAVLTLRAGTAGRELRVVVGTATLDRTPPVFAPPVAATVLELPSLGDVVIGLGETATLTLPLRGAPAGVATPFAVSTSDAAVAQVTAPVVVAAGQLTAGVEIATGDAGEAVLSFVAPDGSGRQIRILVGAPSADRTPPIFASPIGAVVLPLPSLGDVFLAAAAQPTLVLELLPAPSAGTTSFTATSSNPAVAQVVGPVVVASGASAASVTIATGEAGAAVLTFLAGDTGRQIQIVVGAPTADRTPPVLAKPLGAIVLELPSLGELILAPGAARTLALPLLAAPLGGATAFSVASSDPAVAQVVGAVVVAAGDVEAPVSIQAGAAGEAVLTFTSGAGARTVRVVAGTPAPERTPPILATPIGVAVVEEGGAGTLFVDPGESRTLTLDLLGFPSLGDLPVAAQSRDPGVASVSPANQILATGEREITLTVAAGAAPGRTRIDLAFGVERKNLVVEVGVPPAARAPLVVAPPLCVEVDFSASPPELGCLP